jgi:hypothetical protein
MGTRQNAQEGSEMSLKDRITETKYMIEKGTSHNQDSALALENQIAIMEALERIENKLDDLDLDDDEGVTHIIGDSHA